MPLPSVHTTQHKFLSTDQWCIQLDRHTHTDMFTRTHYPMQHARPASPTVTAGSAAQRVHDGLLVNYHRSGHGRTLRRQANDDHATLARGTALFQGASSARATPHRHLERAQLINPCTPDCGDSTMNIPLWELPRSLRICMSTSRSHVFPHHHNAIKYHHSRNGSPSCEAVVLEGASRCAAGVLKSETVAALGDIGRMAPTLCSQL